MKDTGIVILNYNSFNLTLKLIDNLKKIQDIYKIVVVDNASTDESIKYLKEIKKMNIVLIEVKKNGGYASGNNIGIKYMLENYSEINHICVLNPDVELKNVNTFKILKEKLKKDKTLGIIAPLTLINGKVNRKMMGWKSPEKFENIFYSLSFFNKIYQRKNEIINVIPGSFLFFSKRTIEEIDYFDENTFLYQEENILSRKLKKINKKMCFIDEVKYDHQHQEKKGFLKAIFHEKVAKNSRIYYEKNYNKKYSQLTIPIIKVLYPFRIFEVYVKIVVLKR